MARSDELAASVARERLDMQIKAIDGLDTKAAALLGFTGIVLALLFNSETVKESWGVPRTTRRSPTDWGSAWMSFRTF